MGWVRRGEICDEAQLHDPNVRKAELVEATNLTHHVTVLMPTACKICEDIKFDAKSLRHSIKNTEDATFGNVRDPLTIGNLQAMFVVCGMAPKRIVHGE